MAKTNQNGGVKKGSPVQAPTQTAPAILPFKRVFFGLLKNDLEYTTIDELHDKIHSQSHFSVLYFVLLITSVIVSTLGLLINSTAVVIGGMLIAPLTWPLARIGFGVARRARHHIVRGVLLVIASIFIGTLTAFLITYISPIKTLNEEIIARTQPNLMDLFIALSAGLVAAIALTQRKIADSLAGVAIAVSLMPPLSTVGITLSLQRYGDAVGALLLFAVNAACISLVTAIVISYNLYLRTKRFKISTRAAMVNAIFVILLAIPLGYFLYIYSFEVKSYDAVRSALDSYAAESEKDVEFENVKVEASASRGVTVQADALLPNSSTFTYLDNEALRQLLYQAVGDDVVLNLRIQNVFEPISKDQEDNAATIKRINEVFLDEIAKIDDEYKVSSINVTQRESTSADWNITAEVLSDPDRVPLSTEIESLRKALDSTLGVTVDVNVTFLPRLTLKTSDQTVTQSAREAAMNVSITRDGNVEMNNYSMIVSEQNALVTYTLVTTTPDLYENAYVDEVVVAVQEVVKKPVSLRVRLIQVSELVR